MTTISAKIIADSISPSNTRLTTLELRYPRCIHAEFMTHRMFSRNAASSRAIPVERLIQDVIDDPFVPLHWGKNQPGMRAGEEQDRLVGSYDFPDSGPEFVQVSREEAWLRARGQAVIAAREFDQADYHKQIVNRLLEPFAHINVLVTATEWDNFFLLRDHPDAEPHIQILAREMREAMKASRPKYLAPGQWHLPYVAVEDWKMLYRIGEPEEAVVGKAMKLSVARCASVSYKTVEGEPMTLERAERIYDKLVNADVFHASPFEHQATPDSGLRVWKNLASPRFEWDHAEQHGNLCGWRQNRKIIESEL